ncbi:hypothetical protein AK812_SmicGene17140 [Symbiodinium microadriaticum]|uniref:Secreted protein n=1 Tax=Symbiodinium microadriaticum TaxID=2951 RepID=A0A1Q9DYL4_SYMMI|nr:hypothetical protein AK812_SmicGene17140 [Symbiodinium microadriaticum]
MLPWRLALFLWTCQQSRVGEAWTLASLIAGVDGRQIPLEAIGTADRVDWIHFPDGRTFGRCENVPAGHAAGCPPTHLDRVTGAGRLENCLFPAKYAKFSNACKVWRRHPAWRMAKASQQAHRTGLK